MHLWLTIRIYITNFHTVRKYTDLSCILQINSP
jgi:hypothetical protein